VFGPLGGFFYPISTAVPSTMPFGFEGVATTPSPKRAP